MHHQSDKAINNKYPRNVCSHEYRRATIRNGTQKGHTGSHSPGGTQNQARYFQRTKYFTKTNTHEVVAHSHKRTYLTCHLTFKPACSYNPHTTHQANGPDLNITKTHTRTQQNGKVSLPPVRMLDRHRANNNCLPVRTNPGRAEIKQ